MALLVSAAALACLVGQSAAGPSGRLHGIFWIQPALGRSVGDDLVTGRVDAQIGLSGVPIVGSIGATVPVRAEVEFMNPQGVLAGGELRVLHFGLEANVIYLPRAAKARGGLQVCGGLLTDGLCSVIRQGNLLIPGIPVPDEIAVEKDLANLAITLGANYHLVSARRWDIWAGPMVVWSVWSKYDFSDVRLELSTSLEDVLAGKVGEFELAGAYDLAPQNALSFGAGLGGRYDLIGQWSLLAQFRYFAGDDLTLPGGSGRYRAAGLSLGIARRFGG